jgi:hypothetical protein
VAEMIFGKFEVLRDGRSFLRFNISQDKMNHYEISSMLSPLNDHPPYFSSLIDIPEFDISHNEFGTSFGAQNNRLLEISNKNKFVSKTNKVFLK